MYYYVTTVKQIDWLTVLKSFSISCGLKNRKKNSYPGVLFILTIIKKKKKKEGINLS